MKANQDRYTIKMMAGLFGVSRGAYYKWLKAESSNQQKDADDELIRLIREIILNHRRRYGSPRAKKELLKKHGIRVSRKKVAKLMRKHGLNARRIRKYTKTTDSKHSYPVCENILNRDFFAEKPGQKWVSDITYLRTLDGWLYLTVVIDLFDRKVIGWALSDNLETCNTTIPAFEMAVKNRTPENSLIFHSDRGVQYCAYFFRNVIRKYIPNVRQSMSRKGNVWDNACSESFISTIKSELEILERRCSKNQIKTAVFEYIEVYYNRCRRHTALGYAIPIALANYEAA